MVKNQIDEQKAMLNIHSYTIVSKLTAIRPAMTAVGFRLGRNMEVLADAVAVFGFCVVAFRLPGIITGGSAAGTDSSETNPVAIGAAVCSSCSRFSSSMSISASSLTPKCGFDMHSGSIRSKVSGLTSE